MSQILRAIIIAAYIALLIHFLRTLNRSEEHIQISYLTRETNSLKKIMRYIRKSNSAYTFGDTDFRRTLRLHTDLKYILKWTTAFSYLSRSTFVGGQQPFIDSNCTFLNCFLTKDKSLLLDPRHFDAILFDAENDLDSHPVFRAPHQKYIFKASVPSSEYRICNPAFDSFYNWTWTYKLDSIIVQPFFSIYHKNGTLAGPKKDMQWLTSTERVSGMILDKLLHKKKMVAWFASNCKTKGVREEFAEGLTRALELYNFSVDVYGLCGKHVCPDNSVNSCLQMLETDYYFYLAFENFICEDYVSDQVLYALDHYTVPVVFGGANYSRFLPPGSYIDATAMDANSVALLMVETIRDENIYLNYFRWHKHYYFKETELESNLCQLCQSLNEETHAQVHNFTAWWNTGDNACEDTETLLYHTLLN